MFSASVSGLIDRFPVANLCRTFKPHLRTLIQAFTKTPKLLCSDCTGP